MLCYTRHLIHSCFLGHRTFQNTKQNTTSHHRAPNFVPWQPTSSFLLLHLPPLDFPEVYASTSMRKVSQLIHPSINLSGETPSNSQPLTPKCCEAGNSSPSTCCRTAAEALIKGDQMWAGYGKCLNAPRFSFVTAARKSGEKNSFRVDVGDFENSLAWLVHDFDFNGWHCGSILLASSRIITNPFSIVQPCRKPQTQNKHNSHTN